MHRIAIEFDMDADPVDNLNVISAVLRDLSLRSLTVATDEAVLALTAAVEAVGRYVDALRIACAGEVGDRSRASLGPESLAARKGCRHAAELMTRVTRTSGASARLRLKLGAETRAQFSLSGVEFPARFPRIAAALAAGALGVDSAQAIITGLAPVIDSVAIDSLAAAENELVAAATGEALNADDPDADTPDAETPDADLSSGGVPCPADEIRVQAQVWRSVLDPDGLEPSEERLMRRRGFSIPRERDGLLQGTYALLPEVGARFIRLFDACQSPRSAPAFLSAEELAEQELAEQRLAPDPRTPDQLRHDVVAAMVDSFARSGEAPTIGGAAPTVLVSVRASDLASGYGAGWMDGVDAPASLRTVKQFACTGGIQTIRFDDHGRIIELGSQKRCFTRPSAGRSRSAMADASSPAVRFRPPGVRSITSCRMPMAALLIQITVFCSAGSTIEVLRLPGG